MLISNTGDAASPIRTDVSPYLRAGGVHALFHFREEIIAAFPLSKRGTGERGDVRRMLELIPSSPKMDEPPKTDWAGREGRTGEARI